MSCVEMVAVLEKAYALARNAVTLRNALEARFTRVVCGRKRAGSAFYQGEDGKTRILRVYAVEQRGYA